MAPSGRALHCSFTTLCVYENVHGMAQRDVIVNLTNARVMQTNRRTDRHSLSRTRTVVLSTLRPIGAHSSRVSASISALKRPTNLCARRVHTSSAYRTVPAPTLLAGTPDAFPLLRESRRQSRYGGRREYLTPAFAVR